MGTAGKTNRPRGLATSDGLFDGKLQYQQPAGGFRTAVDSLALSYICEVVSKPTPERVLDIGCGSGFLSLMAALLWPDAQVWGVDISDERIACAKENVESNGMESRVKIHCADVMERRYWPLTSCDLVVSNPPFYPLGSGTLPKDPSQAVARFELSLNHEQLAEVAGEAVKPGGMFVCMYPPERVSAVVEAAQNRGFSLRQKYPIAATENQTVFREVLVFVLEEKPSVEIQPEPTLFLESKDGDLGPSLASFVDRICQKLS
ncbi:MAG: hypothetical protein CMH54_01075 [Myxococcales bacterium]|nr:hypothetical protein [Myxococcales bacterium]|tara:strand:- start:1605 stop:2387 length:783 start_codon:yes stop_codon:yes gene_type:complete